VKLTDEIKLKWVNDMVLTDKKVGGVLVKVNNILKDSSYLQVGIGVNVHTSPMATSTCLQEHSKT
jgi:biotin-(acetyl-CoA carboxylase) ligase